MSLTSTSKRLVSLDVLRGITVCGMILVNNAGACGYAYAPLKHAKWDGFTPADLVFPAFMFIMGVSIYLSLNKSNFDWRVLNLIIAALIFRVYFLAPGAEAYNSFLPCLTLYTLLAASLSWISVVRFKAGKQD